MANPVIVAMWAENAYTVTEGEVVNATVTLRTAAGVPNHRRRGKVFNEHALVSQLESLKIDAEAERGIRAYRLLETALLSVALDPSSPACS